MPKRPPQNPLGALAITACLLGGLAAAGYYVAEWRIPESTGHIHAFFVSPDTSAPQYSPLQPPPEPTLPAPELAIASTLHLSPAEAPGILEDALELSEGELPLILPEDVAPETSPTPAPERVKAPQPPARPAARPQPRQQPARQTQQATITPPRLLQAPHPTYPAALKASRRSGQVRVRIHIDAAGRPTAVDILSSSHQAFAESARQCILHKWRFAPATSSGKPIASSAVQTISFKR